MSGIGHFGELWAIEHFQKKLNMPAYLPLKDKGIDFIANKGERFFQIQVKTSMFQKNSYFWFDLHKSKMIYSENTYYIFVCATLQRRTFMGKRKNFLVIPSLKIKEWIGKRILVTKKGDNNILNIFIYPDIDEKQWTYRNKGKEIDLTAHWNNFTYFR